MKLKKEYNIVDNPLFDEIIDDAKLWRMRYEKLRLLNVPEYSRLIKRNMKGENFDDIVDKL
jgi:hypothetical protein